RDAVRERAARAGPLPWREGRVLGERQSDRRDGAGDGLPRARDHGEARRIPACAERGSQRHGDAGPAPNQRRGGGHRRARDRDRGLWLGGVHLGTRAVTDRPEVRRASDSPQSRYEVLAKLAAGGMATVYVGRTRGALGFSRLVAIKRPHPFVVDNPSLVRQLESEARVSSLIHHTNVVSVLDVETIGGEVALVLDYVEGCTLRELFDAPFLAPVAADRVRLRIILDAARGLHAAHSLTDAAGRPLGIVHRDVSPQNMLVGLDGIG